MESGTAGGKGERLSSGMPSSTALVAVTFVVASSYTVHRYAGVAGVVVYAVVVFATMRWLMPIVVAHAERLSEERARLLALAAFVALLIGVLVIYPIANVHTPGRGSDADDMLRQGAESLLHLRYPFDNLSYLGNPVSVLTGSLLLAIPFTLLGSVALANVFWTAGLVYVLQRRTGSTGIALAIAAVVLGLSPQVWYQFATGTDRFSNGVYVLLPLLALLTATKPWTSFLAAAALGFAMCSRVTTLAFLPMAFVFLVRHRGWRWAVTRTAVACAVILALVVPFAIHDVHDFSPITIATTNTHVAAQLPKWLYDSLLVASGALALALAMWWTKTVDDVLRSCIVLQVAAFGALALALSLRVGRFDFEYAAFAALAVPFAACLLASDPASPIARPAPATADREP